MIVAARRDSVRPQNTVGTILDAGALGLVVAMWVSGDMLSGTAIRQWDYRRPVSQIYYAVGWLAVGIHAAVL